MRTDNCEYIQEHEKKALARIWLAETRLTESRQLLESVSSTAREAERNATLVESLVLLALVYWQQGEMDKSMMALAEAIERAEPHGYVRLFADEGEPMREMLSSYRKQTQCMPFRVYIDKVLAAFGPASTTETAGVLSPQEVRILSLIADGVSNKVIAESLYITVGTAKWHVHNILEKLDVNSRTQAINRGRALRII